PRLRAASPRSARNSRPPRAPAPPTPAAPWPPPVSSRRGRGGRARRPCSRRDQLVVACEWPGLDLDLTTEAAATEPLERALVRGVGEREAAGEHAPVATG